MRLKRILIFFYFTLFFILVLCNNVINAEPGIDEKDLFDYSFEFDLKNNLLSLESLLNTKEIIEEVKGGEDFPNYFLGLEKRDLMIRLMDNGIDKKGIFYHKLGWNWATRETVEFVKDYAELENLDDPRFYDIGFQNEKYDLIGLYAVNQFEMGESKIILDKRFFSCVGYEKLNLVAQGDFNTSIDNNITKEIYGNYRLISKDKDKPGWGTGLNWGIYLNFNPNLKLDLYLDNFPCFIYLPSQKIENGKIDSGEASIQPISITGFTSKESGWIILPIEAKGNLNLLLGEELLRLKLSSVGLVQNFSCEYIHCLTKKLKTTIEVNPIMESVTVGCIYFNSEFKLSLMPFSNWQLNGLSISVKL